MRDIPEQLAEIHNSLRNIAIQAENEGKDGDSATISAIAHQVLVTAAGMSFKTGMMKARHDKVRSRLRVIG